jgi:hypothetical protein
VKLEARPSAAPRDSGRDLKREPAFPVQPTPFPAPVAATAAPAAPSSASDPKSEGLPDEADPELRIARLEGKVAALAAALERRSGELRQLQRYLCARDLVQWDRQLAGLPPLPRIAHEPAFWSETRELTLAEVPETLLDLWSSLYPAAKLASPLVPPPPDAPREPLPGTSREPFPGAPREPPPGASREPR